MMPMIHASESSAESPLDSSAIRILLIDDKEDHFIMTRRLFAAMKRGRYLLEWVPTFERGLEQIAQNQHDVYLVDHHLGPRNGLDLIRKAREQGCRVPMILFTAGDDPDADLQALEVGATDYLAKGKADAVLLERTVLYAIQHTQQITALQVSQQALRASEERLRIAINAAEMGTVDWNIPANKVTYGGHFARLMRLNDLNQAETFEDVLALVHPDDRAYVQEMLINASQNATHYDIEFRLCPADHDECWRAAQGEVYCNADGTPVRMSGVVQDITERKLIERERTELLEREQEARRIAEEATEMKLRFLAMVSHELRTPLTSIKGFTSTLLEDDVVWSLEQYQEFIDIIDHETDKLTDLVAQLMDISRLQAGAMPIQLQPHHVSSVIEGALPQIEAATEGHQFVLNVPGDLPMVMADRRRVEQVIVNLVDNAAKYSPDGTEIEISAVPGDNYIRINVDDHGQGIAPEHRERVFEAFHQLGTGQKGAGLGLAICRGLIEAHGGQIWVDDRKGSPGTRVSFTLAIASPEAFDMR